MFNFIESIGGYAHFSTILLLLIPLYLLYKFGSSLFLNRLILVLLLFNFLILYKVTSRQLVKEKAKFARKYESLNSDQVTSAHKQSTNRTFVRTVAHKI